LAKLDLDINANGEVLSLDQVLGKGNVVGELYDAGSHTTDPQWINKFKERGYDIMIGDFEYKARNMYLYSQYKTRRKLF